MSVSFKLVSRGLIGPLFSKRISGLAGMCSNVDITGVTGTAGTTPQRNLHLSCLAGICFNVDITGVTGTAGTTPQRNLHLSCLAGICSNVDITGVTGTAGTTPQRNLHLSSLPQKLLNATERPINHTIIRLFSSTSEDSSLGHLVYKGRVAKGLRALKIFSLSTSAIGLLAQPYLLITYQNMPLVAALPIFATLNCFVFVNPLLIHFIAKKYVTELYFNPDTKVFTAHLLTFFARRQVITFTAADVAVPDVPNMFAMLTVRGRPLFVHEDDFTSLEVYKHLMGFDRPLKFVGEDAVNPSYQHQDKTNT